MIFVVLNGVINSLAWNPSTDYHYTRLKVEVFLPAHRALHDMTLVHLTVFSVLSPSNLQELSIGQTQPEARRQIY